MVNNRNFGMNIFVDLEKSKRGKENSQVKDKVSKENKSQTNSSKSEQEDSNITEQERIRIKSVESRRVNKILKDEYEGKSTIRKWDNF